MMDIYQMYFGQPYEVLAQYKLEQAEELAQFYSGLLDYIEFHQTITPKTFDLYPGIWRREEDDSLVQIGPRPEMNREAWEMANRRFASQVLASWEQKCQKYSSNRQFQIAWREGSGVDEWEDGLNIQMIVFFDGDFDPSFTPGMPASPEPLTETERQALITPVYPYSQN